MEPTGITPGGGTLPDQTGQDGKFLKTTGGVAVWSSVQNEVFQGLTLGETSTPTTAADQIKLYLKSDGKIYYRKESNGAEHLLKEDDVIPFYVPFLSAGMVLRYRNNGNTKLLVSVNHQTDSGAATFSVAINGVAVGGLSGITVGTTDTTTTATSSNSVPVGALISLSFDGVTSPVNCRTQLYLRDA
jgi:hypothetical protein